MRRRTRLRAIALPRRREVTTPARNGLAFSTASTPNTNSFPRCTTPSRFTRSNSEARVNRRVFGNENETGGAISVQQKSSRKDIAGRLCNLSELSEQNYGLG